MAERPRTPPRASLSGNIPRNPLTPEQIRKTEEARLRAKAARAQHDASLVRQSSGPITGQKRTHAQATASSSSSIATSTGPAVNRNVRAGNSTMSTPAADTAMLRPANKFATHQFIEYDLSRMTDTKGGFLSQQDDPHNRVLHAPERKKGNEEPKPAGMSVEEWERIQLLRKLRANQEPALSVLVNEKEKREKSCRGCGSLEVDFKWLEVFGCAICKACREKEPEMYSLLTKTEAREDYLLTNPELNDEEVLPHMKKPNPHMSAWNDMQLYLRYQVEEYAFSDRKWGSPEALDAEFERRRDEKSKRKEQRFKTKLEELKKRTRTDAYRRGRNIVEKGSKQPAGLREEGGDTGPARFGMRLARGDRHVHDWSRPILNGETGMEVKTCKDCGAECEEFEL